jgi:hypothetical protein
LTLANLPEFSGGTIAGLFDLAVSAIGKDCTDRPALKKARKVTIVVEATPLMNTDGDVLRDVALTIRVNTTIPEQALENSVARINNKGQMAFSPFDRRNPDQLTLLNDDNDEDLGMGEVE